MALFAGKKHFCKVVWMEAGDTVVRRIYRLTIQQPSGLVEHLEGKDLPDAMVIQTGPSIKPRGASMQVLMQPDSRAGAEEFGRFPIEHPWPRRRDLMHMGVGVTLLGMLRLFLYLNAISQ